MIETNGKTNGKYDVLDQVLSEQEPEKKARVLEIILKYNIDPRDEFFIIFVALGHLQILMEESPQNWGNLFQSFEGELNQWIAIGIKIKSNGQL